MENISKVQQTIARPTNISKLALFAGLGLVAVLGGLTGLNPRIGVVGVLALLLLVVIIPRPILIVYGLAFMLPLTAGAARGSIVPFLRLGQAILVLGFLLFVLAMPSRQGKSRLTAIDLAFVLFFLTEAVFPVLALLYNGEQLNLNSTGYYGAGTPLQTLAGPLQYYLLYRIVVAIISSEKQIIAVLKLSFVASIIVSIIGILQKLQVAPVKTFLDTYYPPFQLHPNLVVSATDLRITSTLESYSGLAAYLSFTIIVALVCYTAQKQLKISPLLLAATMLFDSTAMVLTGTFAVWFGLAVGAFVVFKLARLKISRSLLKLMIFILVGIVLAALVFHPFISSRLADWLGGGGQGLLPTYVERIRLWRELFLPVIGQHLLFGAGPAPQVLEIWPSEETQYLALLLKGGLPHFFSYFLLMGVAMVICWYQIKSNNEAASRTVAIATLAIVVALNVMNVSAVYFNEAGGAQTIWMLLAMVVASRQFNGKNSPQISSTVPNSIGPQTSRWDRCRRRFVSMIHVLDWHFVKDSVVVGAGSTISRVLGLLFAILLAHFLTPDDYGFFRYAVTLAGIIAIAATASPISIARFLAANPNDPQARDRYFSNGLLGVALLLVGSLLISVPILWLMHALDIGTISCIFGLAGYYSYLAVVRGLGSAWKMSLNYTLSNVALIAALLVVIGLLRLHTATVALLIYGLTNVVQILVLELIKPITLRFRPSLISKAVLLELARFATPMVVSTGAYTLWNGIDLLLVENLAPYAAGSYAAAKTLTSVFAIVPAVITMVLMPRVAALGPQKSKRYALGAILAVFLISLIGLVIVDLWGHTVITLTFGERYSAAYFPLLVQSVGMTIFSVYTVVEGVMIGRGRPNLAVQALVMALVGTAATGFWLTSWLGPVGASLSFTIGATLGTVVMLFNTWRALGSDTQVANSQPSIANQSLNTAD